MGKGLKIAAPPPRPAAQQEPATEAPAATAAAAPAPPRARPSTGGKFDQVREGQMVQFNKRVPQAVADAFAMLEIRTKRKMSDLLTEAVELLQEKHGRV